MLKEAIIEIISLYSKETGNIVATVKDINYPNGSWDKIDGSIGQVEKVHEVVE